MTPLSSWWTRKGVKPAFDAPWCNHEYRRLMSRSLRHVSDGSRGGAVFDSFAILCSMLDGTGSKLPAHIAQRLIIRWQRWTHGPEMEPGEHGGVCGSLNSRSAMASQTPWRRNPWGVSHGGRGRREQRRTKRDPGERCQGTAAGAMPCVAGIPPISGAHRPQGQLLWQSYGGSRSRSLSSPQRPRRSSDRLTEQLLRELGVSVPSQDIRPQVC